MDRKGFKKYDLTKVTWLKNEREGTDGARGGSRCVQRYSMALWKSCCQSFWIVTARTHTKKRSSSTVWTKSSPSTPGTTELVSLAKQTCFWALDPVYMVFYPSLAALHFLCQLACIYLNLGIPSAYLSGCSSLINIREHNNISKPVLWYRNEFWKIFR